MERPKYHSVREMLQMINRPAGAREGCIALLDEHEKLFKVSLGSTNNHQVYLGGYWDHVCEAMNLAVLLFSTIASTGRAVPFTLSDALLAVFLHDLEKPWKYEEKDGKVVIVAALEGKDAQHEFRMRMVKDFEIYLSDEVKNAIRFSEGEGDRFTPSSRQMGELAAFVHMCDNLSARLFHAHPLERDDPWSGPDRPSSK